MASRSVNKVILIGHLGKDAETKFTTSGTAKTTFTLATNRRWKDQQSGEWKDETDWHNILAWKAENVANYLQKGKQIYVEGRLHTRSYEDKDGQKRYITEVVAENIILLSSGGGGGGDFSGPGEYAQSGSAPRPQQRQPQPAAPPDDFGATGINDDDVPF
jgi:single-strand DNA-binding protein